MLLLLIRFGLALQTKDVDDIASQSKAAPDCVTKNMNDILNIVAPNKL